MTKTEKQWRDFLLYYGYRLIVREASNVSKGNGYYDWKLSTWQIAIARIDLEQAMEMFYREKINRNQFVAAIHLYFNVVYCETERVWLEKWNPSLPAARPERCESLWLSARDLEFINIRFHQWVSDERYGFIEPDFDNKIPQEDLSHIKVDEVMSLDYIINWGKYRLQQYTLRGLIDRDPQWLHWAITQTNRLKVSEEIMTMIVRAQSEPSR